MVNRSHWLLLSLLCLAGCYYENPYAGQLPVRGEESLELERAFLTAEQMGNGAPGPSSTSFLVSQPVYASAVLSGEGEATVRFVLLKSEESNDEMAAVQVKADLANLIVTQDITAASGALMPGTYYVSVRVNGVPSWGVPFTVLPSTKGSTNAPVER